MEAKREGSFSDLKQLVDLGDIIGVYGGLKVGPRAYRIK
jgi:hypothetical protein